MRGLLFLLSASLVLLGLFLGFPWYMWLAGYLTFFVVYNVGGIVGNHRYFAHRSFESTPFKECIMLFCAAVFGPQETKKFVILHHDHHRFSDTDKDPHPPWKVTFLNMSLKSKSLGYSASKDTVLRFRYLLKNPRIRFFSKYKYLIMLMYNLLLFGFFGLSGVIFFWAMPFFLEVVATYVSAKLVHIYGYQNYEIDDSKNLWWAFVTAFGDAWHNNHHKYPGRQTTKVKWWEIDPSYIFVRLLRKRNV